MADGRRQRSLEEGKAMMEHDEDDDLMGPTVIHTPPLEGKNSVRNDIRLPLSSQRW